MSSTSRSKKSNWHKSDRKSRLPQNWEALRRVVGKRDDWTCQWRFSDGTICGLPGNQIDHIIPSGSDDPENLRCLCEAHHAIKSSREGGRAAQEELRALKERVRRKPEENAPRQFPGPKPMFKGF